jgi:S1-C subfamily serine protease
MSDAFEQLSTAIADVVDGAAKSIVRVEARKRMPASGIVWSTDGLIVSANHVVERDDEVGVGLPDGTKTSAEVVGRDPTTDLVVLRAEANGLTVPEWSAAGDLRVGGLSIAAGRPYHSVEVSVGALSAIGGAWRTQGGGRIDAYMRPEITMYPGFSGGPLVLVNGQFAGLNTSGLLHHSDATIPTETLRRTVEALVAHGRIPRGYLGVGVQPVRISAKHAESLPSEVGLMIMSVEENSPAEAAGVRQGDILVSLGDDVTASVSDLRVALSSIDADSTVTLRIIRGDDVAELAATVEPR